MLPQHPTRAASLLWRRCCTVAAKGLRGESRTFSCLPHFTCRTKCFERSDAGIELASSAVQRRQDSFPKVSRVCKMPANEGILTRTPFSAFQEIYAGCYTIAARGWASSGPACLHERPPGNEAVCILHDAPGLRRRYDYSPVVHNIVKGSVHPLRALSHS